jgi:hypothetical protein
MGILEVSAIIRRGSGRLRRGLLLSCLLFLGIILVFGGAPALAQPTATFTPSATATLTPQPTLTAGYGPIRSPDACGLPYNPCGPLPFPLPRFPTMRLPSPTLIETIPSPTFIPITATFTPSETPSNTPTGSHTPTITPTGSPTIAGTGEQGDVDNLADLFGHARETLRARMTAQYISRNGTPIGIAGAAHDLGENLGGFFGMIRVAENVSVQGSAFSMIGFMFLALLFALLVNASMFIIPLVLGIINFIGRIIAIFKPR